MTHDIAWSEEVWSPDYDLTPSVPVFDYPAHQENLPAWSRNWQPETDSPPTAPIILASPTSDLNMAALIVGILAALMLGALMFVALVMTA